MPRILSPYRLSSGSGALCVTINVTEHITQGCGVAVRHGAQRARRSDANSTVSIKEV